MEFKPRDTANGWRQRGDAANGGPHNFSTDRCSSCRWQIYLRRVIPRRHCDVKRGLAKKSKADRAPGRYIPNHSQTRPDVEIDLKHDRCATRLVQSHKQAVANTARGGYLLLFLILF
jgi:hypothetical protein